MRELVVHAVRIEMPSGEPILLLRDIESNRAIPIWIGANEASAIANAMEGVEPPRPMTHDLFADVLEAFGHSLEEVRIVDIQGGTFFGIVVIDGDEISCRPSDAVAMALRLGAPIYGTEELLAQVGVEVPAEREEEVEKFREFLDNINPEDFDSPESS